jgi:hypothetical protein
MPYIHQDDRLLLELNGNTSSTTPGELNYVITNVCIEYMNTKGKNYQTVNDIVGALENAKLEFYRRIAAPYEDLKIQQNGDVY